MTNDINNIDRSIRIAQQYGVNETNPLWTSEATHENVDFSIHVTLGSPEVARVVRLRLLTEPGYPYFDISYCYVQLKDGRYARLSDTPMSLGRKTLKRDLIAWAREEGAYAKGLGLLDDNNWSILR
jgi:hypothetical protein